MIDGNGDGNGIKTSIVMLFWFYIHDSYQGTNNRRKNMSIGESKSSMNTFHCFSKK